MSTLVSTIAVVSGIGVGGRAVLVICPSVGRLVRLESVLETIIGFETEYGVDRIRLASSAACCIRIITSEEWILASRSRSTFPDNYCDKASTSEFNANFSLL